MAAKAALITVALLSNGCSPRVPCLPDVHACLQTTVNATLSPDRAPLRYSEDIRVAANSSVSLIGRHTHTHTLPPQAPDRVLRCQSRGSAATQSSFSISSNPSRLGRSVETQQLPFLLWEINLTCPWKCLFKPDRKIGIYSTVSSYRAKSTLTNLQ